MSPALILMALDLVVAGGDADQRPDRREEPHGLLDHHARIGELLHLVPFRIAVAADGARLGADALERLGVLRQQIERPGERQRRGLGAGPQILLHLVDHLLAIELGEVRVGLGLLQHAEQRLLAMLEHAGADHRIGDRAPDLHGLGGVSWVISSSWPRTFLRRSDLWFITSV